MIDIVIALLGLVVFGLPLLIAAMAIHLESPGPILFRQRRIGFANVGFEVWKLRTMRHAAAEPSRLTQARRNDPRVTRVGAWLRRSSLDELPQLFNVLRGDMSIVGPRPHAPGTCAAGKPFELVTPHYPARHRVLPGLTGLAQVRGWRGETETEEKLRRRVEADLEYIENWSLWLDLTILARTLVSLPVMRNAYLGRRITIMLHTLPVRENDRLSRPAGFRVAVLIPCYNEELAVAKVVEGFRDCLPDATILVYDNNSSDRTRQVAGNAGAVVRREALQGKGHVVRRMFADVEADIYVLVDGDDTYDPAAAPVMVRRLIEHQLDMVTAVRLPVGQQAYRLGQCIGNRALSRLVCHLFGNRISDVLSGYRVFSRQFVKSFPALAAGFETETEFTIHALELRMPIDEVASKYRGRGAGSRSKLNTISDGLRILRTIMRLVQQERPLQWFGLTGAALMTTALGLGLPVVLEFLRSGEVPRLPTALLATGLVLASSLSFVCGLVLDQVAHGRQELKRLAYLSIPAIGNSA